LRQKYTELILPVAVYLRVGLNGIGIDSYEERLGDFQVVQYNYLYVGLPALEAERYLQRGEALAAALAATMSISPDRRPDVKAPLERPEEQQEFDRLIQTEQFSEVQRMATTWYAQGMVAGQLKAIHTRFGPIPLKLRQRLEACPEEKLSELLRLSLAVESLEELRVEDLLQ
jgi:hypothetical protein